MARIAEPPTLFTINDLYDHHINRFVRHAIVEGYVLNRYGTFDRASSMKGPDSPPKYITINADITDCKGLTTVTVTCYQELVCGMFTDKLHPGKTIRISDFEIKNRAERYEHGDINRTIRLNTQSRVELIQPFTPPVVLKFFGSGGHNIASFRKVLEQPYSYSSLSVVVYEVLPAKEQILTVKIADGFSDEDVFVLDMGVEKRTLYDDICAKISNNDPPLLHLKNLTINRSGSCRSFKINRATIVTEVQSEKSKVHLRSVYSFRSAQRSRKRSFVMMGS